MAECMDQKPHGHGEEGQKGNPCPHPWRGIEKEPPELFRRLGESDERVPTELEEGRGSSETGDEPEQPQGSVAAHDPPGLRKQRAIAHGPFPRSCRMLGAGVLRICSEQGS
jgi:hypothetical protein